MRRQVTRELGTIKAVYQGDHFDLQEITGDISNEMRNVAREYNLKRYPFGSNFRFIVFHNEQHSDWRVGDRVIFIFYTVSRHALYTY